MALRIPVSADENAGSTYAALRHFFRSSAFQRWSIFNRPRAGITSWADYAFTGDELYLRSKTKEPSLKEIFDGEKHNPPPREWPPKKRPDWWPEEGPRREDGVAGAGEAAPYMMDDFVPRWIWSGAAA